MAHNAKFASPVLPDTAQWIRLLRIDSRLAGEVVQEGFDRDTSIPLCCTLQIFEQTSLPEYTALSYTCGKPIPDDLPQPHDKSKAMPMTEALHSLDIDWTELKWHLKVNEQQFYVARNLRDAMMRLADTHIGSWIWIDAICIDQNDLEERNAQVEIMWMIYSQAKTVRVWLGEEDETAAETKMLQDELCEKIMQRGEARANQAAVGETCLSVGKDWDTAVAEGIPMQRWWSWCHFYRRTWFERVWTMQEYVLAQKLDLVCGSLNFDHEACIRVAKFVKNSTWNSELLMELEPTTPIVHIGEPEMLQLNSLRSMCVQGRFTFVRDLAMIKHVFGIKSASAWLLTMMNNSRRRLVSDARDRIYGMAGMISYVGGKFGIKQDIEWLKVDYSMSCQLLSVMIAGNVVMALPILAYLSLVRYRPVERVITERLPSWTVDLEERDTGLAIPFGFQTVHERAAYDASGCESMEASLLHSRRDASKGLYLVLKVLLIDDIDEVVFEGPNDVYANMEDILTPVLRFIAEGSLMYTLGARSQWLPEAVWRTLIADSTHECPAEADTAASFKEYVLSMILNTYVRRVTASDFESHIKSRTQNLDYLDKIHQRFPAHAAACLPTRSNVLDALHGGRPRVRSSNWREMVKRFASFLAHPGRKLVRSSGGGLALVPREASKGDALVIIAGARVPFVVKLHTVRLLRMETMEYDVENSLAFQLVGEAYLHCAMHGELCHTPAEGGVSPPWYDFTFI